MKKFIIILLSVLILAGCQRDYKCVLTYQVDYPDTTWVNTYVFDGHYNSGYKLTPHNGLNHQWLNIYRSNNDFGRTILSVPIEYGEITVLDFKMYRYGIDIPKKEKKNKKSK